MFKEKKILALIPARGGSKGIKNKNLRKINGKPLIYYTINFINKLKFVDLKIVSSDKDEILNYAKKNGFVAFRRNKKLSGDKISDYQVIESILNSNIADIKKFDYLIYLQPTSPLRKSNELNQALNKLIKLNYDAIWSVTEIDKKFHPLKVFINKKNKLNLFSEKGKKIIARQQLKRAFIRNGVFYIFSIKKIMKTKSIYMKKTLPFIIKRDVINIDNLEDLKIAKKMLTI